MQEFQPARGEPVVIDSAASVPHAPPGLQFQPRRRGRERLDIRVAGGGCRDRALPVVPASATGALFPDAEAREDPGEQVLARELARHFRQRLQLASPPTVDSSMAI